jgi:hypothetical protein
MPVNFGIDSRDSSLIKGSELGCRSLVAAQIVSQKVSCGNQQLSRGEAQ